MDANNSDSTALHDYVSALLECTGALMQIVSHMAEAEAAATAPPDADDVPTVLARLIKGVLAPALGLEDLRVAAAVVEKTSERIAEEIYLVPHSAEE